MLVTQYDESDLSTADFCKQHHISQASLSKWRSLLKPKKTEQKSTPDFVELTPQQPSTSPPSNDWSVELVIGQQILLRIR